MSKNTKILVQEFKSGQYAERLKDIYVDDAVLDYQKERYIKAIEEFEKLELSVSDMYGILPLITD